MKLRDNECKLHAEANLNQERFRISNYETADWFNGEKSASN